MSGRRMVAIGGASFIVGALTFILVFAFLATRFDYPDVLDGAASEVLPRLREGGSTMRAVWAIYSFLPLCFIPGAVGAFYACPSSRPRMTLGLVVATVAAFAMCLGLMRWPSINWALAEAYSLAGADTKSSLEAVFAGLNSYLGNYIGEFLGETMLAAFILLSSLAVLDETHLPAWLGWSGLVFAPLFFVGAFRNVLDSIRLVADANNSLLPLWMIVFGTTLLLKARTPAAPSES